MTVIDPRIRTANYDRYDILSSFDLPRINRELGTTYTTLGQVYQAQREAFDRLTPWSAGRMKKRCVSPWALLAM